jgi:hypothetical protein
MGHVVEPLVQMAEAYELLEAITFNEYSFLAKYTAGCALYLSGKL